MEDIREWISDYWLALPRLYSTYWKSVATIYKNIIDVYSSASFCSSAVAEKDYESE